LKSLKKSKKDKADKCNRILQAAIEEFAEKGYKAASTNVIANNAKVSKGLVFKYFKSKENLYLETLIYAIDQIQKEFNDFLKSSETDDFFEILRSWGLKKLQLLYEKPTLSKFLLTALDVPKELFEKVKAIHSEVLTNSIPLLYKYFSKLPLRKDIPKEKLFEFLLIIFQSLGDTYTKKFFQKSSEILEKKEEFLKDWELYMEIIKNGILRNNPSDSLFQNRET